MLSKILGKKAQSTAEYAIIVGLVIGAIALMQVYVKRALQAKVKETTDTLSAKQYEPYYVGGSQEHGAEQTTTQTRERGGGVVASSTAKTTGSTSQESWLNK